MAAEDRFCQAKSKGTSDGPLPTHRVSRLSLEMTWPSYVRRTKNEERRTKNEGEGRGQCPGLVRRRAAS